jgi:dephospho-CoA kinase
VIIYSDFSAGVDEIEQLAQKQQLEILRSGQYNREELRNPIFEDGEKIELLTRIMVRSRFIEVLCGKLEQSLLNV